MTGSGRCLCFVGVACLVLDVVCASCSYSDVKVILSRCSSHLAAICSSILDTVDTNFTRTCRHYETYVDCVEPQLQDCSVRTTQDFWMDKYRYNQSPYNCTAPLYPGNALVDAAAERDYRLPGPNGTTSGAALSATATLQPMTLWAVIHCLVTLRCAIRAVRWSLVSVLR